MLTYSSFSREVRAGIQGRPLEAGTEAVAMEECSLMIGFHAHVHATFLKQTMPTMGQALLHQLAIETMFHSQAR